MTRWLPCLTLVLALCSMSPAKAAPCPAQLAQARITGNWTLQGPQGENVNLTGLWLPADALRRPDVQAALNARLTALVENGPLTLADSGGDGKTCHAQVTNAKGIWLQEQLILEGMATASHKPVADKYLPSLMLAEEKARRSETGIWAQAGAVIRDPRTIRQPQFNNTFQIVEGQVLFAKDFNRVIQSCFGQTMWDSVCLVVLRPVYQQLKEQGVDLMAQNTGLRVRARGEVNYREDAGLKLFVDNPQIIEVIGVDSEQATRSATTTAMR